MSAPSEQDVQAALAKAADRPLRASKVVVHLPVPWSQVAWGGLAVGVLAGVVLLAAHARAVSIPLVTAFCLAYVLNPLVERMVRVGVPRTWAIVLLLLTFLATSVLAGLLLGPRIWQEAREVPDKLRQFLHVVRPWALRVFDLDVPDSLDSILLALQAELNLKGQAPLAALAQRATGALSLVFGGTLSALASLGAVAVTPVFAFFFLRDFPTFKQALKSLWPVRARPALERTLAEMDGTLSSFIRGQIMVGGVLSLLYVGGFYVVQLPLALLLGLVTGLGNMVPFVGTAVGLSFATLVTVLSWHGWASLIAVWAVFGVNHLLETWLITPRIVGGSVGLSPFWIILAVLSFGELFGFLGVLVAVPLAAILKILWREIFAQYRASTFYVGPKRPA